jgi:hypothetical protein
VLFAQPIIDAIADCATWADRLCRADLVQGIIATENDYTSNLTAAFRREIAARHIPGLTATAHLLNPTLERKYGADACLVFMSGAQFKICLFEGKWPRLQTRTNYWDSVQKSGLSHFHSQLLRQAPFSKQFAIWEMFYCEFPFFGQPKFMSDEGSACAWHEPAHSATLARSDPSIPWTDAELVLLLTKNAIELGDVVRAACECSAGIALPGHDYMRQLADIGVPRNLVVVTYQADLDSERR